MRTSSRRRASFALAALALFGLAACGGDDDDGPPAVEDGDADTGAPATEADLERATWRLVSYVDDAAEGLTAASDEQDATARFDGSTIAGSTGCNQYSGPYELSGDGAFSIGDTAVTNMLCSDALNRQEQAVLAGLTNAARAVIADDQTLQMLGDNGDVLLIWQAAAG
jgi:heat shock protein HslJ